MLSNSGKKLYPGTVGVVIKVDCGEVLNPANSYELRVEHPCGRRVIWPVSIVESTKLQFITTKVSDLPIPGVYKLQPHNASTFWTGLGKTAQLRVYAQFT